MSVSLVYVNTADRAEAQRIGRAIVDARLAAGANILPEISSVFHWQGGVREAGEAMLILKTRSELIDAVIDRVRALHSYECPSVVAVPVTAGNPDYLAWVGRETSAGQRD